MARDLLEAFTLVTPAREAAAAAFVTADAIVIVETVYYLYHPFVVVVVVVVVSVRLACYFNRLLGCLCCGSRTECRRTKAKLPVEPFAQKHAD